MDTEGGGGVGGGRRVACVLMSPISLLHDVCGQARPHAPWSQKTKTKPGLNRVNKSLPSSFFNE